MENKRKQGYLYAFFIGMLTVLVCMVIADGFIGIAGTIHDYKEFEDGTHEFTSITTTLIFWIVQAMVLLFVQFLCFIIRKFVRRQGGE